MATEIQIRRDTAANWTLENPTLAQGEIGYETDTNQFKIGDGLTAWSSLGDYFVNGVASGGISDGTKGDITVSGSGTVWTVDTPLLLGEDNVDPYFNATPLDNHLMTIGYGNRHALAADGDGIVGLEIGLPVTNNALAGPTYGQVISVNVQGTATLGSVTGLSTNLFCNASAATDPSSVLTGVESNVDVGGTWENAIGGSFSAFSGGSGSSSLTSSFTGVLGSVGAVHNGNTGEAWAGDFELFTSTGSPGTLGVGASVRAKLRLNSGATLTDYRGVSISDWTQSVGCGITNAYGLYIDNTLDSVGTSSRYAIRSLAAADSLFTGPVRGPVNAYDATTWNGSTKFATEDAVRDKFESLGTTSVTGTGAADRFAMWTSASVLTNVPMTYSSGFFRMFNSSPSDTSQLVFLPYSATASQTQIGATNGGSVLTIQADSANPQNSYGNLDFETARLGDYSSVGTGAYIQVDSSFGNSAYRFYNDGYDATLDYASVKYFVYQRSLSTTTGAKTINLPAGSVKLAAGQTTLVVTNNSADANSLIFLTPQSSDATAKSFAITRASGSFTITANAAATADTHIGFLVTN